ncbi:site-2 protease family protein [Paenibacillus chartarius]|uniref:Site-2 protease family protein n=1 Tax=Paenibacillus chartarius TaxID=747481 RepID=A0ABV6DVF9_9BACL
MATSRKPGGPKWAWTAVLLFIVTKLKSIAGLLKFSKVGGTLLTMLVSVGAYAIAYPLPFAIGFVVLILIHELGHSIAAKQKGLPVSAPIFIPFIGALIAMKRHPRDAATEAYIAFGGPLLGTIGAVLFLAAGVMLDNRLLISLANVGFMLNLINLLPIHPLDGGRISTAVTRWLWLVGLIAGLVVIIDLFSPSRPGSWIFVLLWVMFAWDLYQKFVRKRLKPDQQLIQLNTVMVPYASLYEQGLPFPGQHHRRELSFTTWSDLSTGEQTVRYTWEGYIDHAERIMPNQAVIHKVEAVGCNRHDDTQELSITSKMEFSPHVNDRYYEVPVRTRWMFGIAYGVLAAALGTLIYAANHLL